MDLLGIARQLGRLLLVPSSQRAPKAPAKTPKAPTKTPKSPTKTPKAPAATPKPTATFKPKQDAVPTVDASYPGDYTQLPEIVYDPHPDGRPDPGEIVWTWVPYEEDHSQGKDRPVLLIGRDGRWLLGLQVTSQDHDRDAAQEARAGRLWMDIGAGEWDQKRRPSEVRVNRIIRIDPDGVRRVGAILDRAMFDAVAQEVQKNHAL